MPASTIRNILAAAVVLTLAGVAHAGEALESRLNALLAAPLVKGASISLDIVEVTPKGPVGLFSHNATTPLGPASNCKLLTTAAAFERYGSKATFKTLLYQVGDAGGTGVDLLLVGGGDPAFGDSKLASQSGQTATSAFDQWADRLKQAGVTKYHDLIVDDRIFDTQWVHPNWPADQRLDWYCAPIGGLNFNANCLDWTPKISGSGISVELLPDTTYIHIINKATRGKETRVSLLRPADSNKFELRGTLAASATTPYSVPIYDPGLWTGTILRDVLARNGIQNSGQIRRAASEERFGESAGARLLASHETPIQSVLQRANTNSLNMMAEGLCKRLGYDASNGTKPGSWATGTAAVEAYAISVGAKADWVSLEDGSGLSNKNRVAAKAFTTVLAHVAGRPDAQFFIDTLAVPKEDGTLERRFKNMSVAEHVHAKTGHITGVSTLSGYIQTGTAKGRLFAFSILVNKYQGNVNPWQDQVCQALYDWSNGK